MRMLDANDDRAVKVLQLYLSVDEARDLRDGLGNLLADPESSEHVHLFDRDLATELSYSIVTDRKLRDLRYTARERGLFSEG